MTTSDATSAPAAPRGSRRQHLAALDRDARIAAVDAYLRQRLGVWLMADAAKLDAWDPQSILTPLGKDWAFLAHTLLKDLSLRLYPNELRGIGSIAALARYVAGEIADAGEAQPASGLQGSWPWTPAAAPSGPRVGGTAFVLSTPRAGSTLLRVMLEGHSALFAPPELWLLPFGTARARREQLRTNGFEYLGLGLEHAVSTLWELDDDAAAAHVAAWEASDASVEEVYRQLGEKSAGTWLIDKTPGYASSVAWMQQAEQRCDDAHYLLLVRHPYAVIESFVRMRFHRMLGPLLGLWHDDPWTFGAMVWDQWNRNALAFLETVPAARHTIVRYEDVVGAPEATMTRIASFFGVPFEPAMMDPYAENRMIFRGAKQVVTTGDPNFSQRDKLDPSLAEWRHLKVPAHVAPLVRELAARFDYEIPS